VKQAKNPGARGEARQEEQYPDSKNVRARLAPKWKEREKKER